MRSITREALIDRLTELEPRSTVEPAVDQAIEALGWQDKTEMTALEVIALGTVMAEQARVTLAASDDPSHRQAAADMKPLVNSMREDVLPILAEPHTQEGA